MNKTYEASPGDGSDVKAQYEAYVKSCVRSRRKPLEPDAWFDQLKALTGVFLDTQPAPGASAAPAVKLVSNEEQVRSRFTRLMVQEAVNNDKTLFERAMHYLKLGDERPLNVSQVAPCVLCGDMLCAWAGVKGKSDV